MRQLSQFEKEFIKDMVTYQSTNLSTYFYGFLIDNYFTAEKSRALIVGDNFAYLHLFKKNENSGIKFNQEIKKIIDIFCLLDLLERECYVYINGDPNFVGKYEIIYDNNENLLDPDKAIEIMERKEGVLLDEQDYKKVIYYFYRNIHITQGLIELLRSGFRTQEQIRHEESLKVTWTGIYTAWVIGIISALIGIASLLF